MKNIAILILFISIQTLAAQVTFNKHFHFNFPAAAICSIQPVDSGYVTTGIVVDSLSPFLVGSFFAEFDFEGNLTNFKPLLSPIKSYEMWVGDLIRLEDGSFLDIGYTVDSLMKGLLVKFDEHGDTIFTKEFINPNYPGASFIVSAALTVDGDGNMFLMYGIMNNDAEPSGDILLLKLDSIGDVIAEYEYGSNISEVPKSILLENDGGLIIGAGKTNVNQTWNNFSSQSYIFKVDSFGGIVWEHTSWIGWLQDIAFALVRSEDGGLVIGTSKGYEQQISASQGSLRFNKGYFYKLDSTQHFDWSIEISDSIYDGSLETGIHRLISVDEGEAYIGAGHFPVVRSLDPPVGGVFGWFIKFSDDGELIWIRKHQLATEVGHSHRIYDLKPTPDGGFIAAGEIRGTIAEGEPTLQGWLLKLDQHGCLIPGCEAGDTVVLANGQAVEVPLRLAIYPNPTSDFLNFQLRTARPVQAATFRITDLAGRPVREIQSAGAKDTHIVPVQGWSAGVYFLQYLEDGQVRAVERFVVE